MAFENSEVSSVERLVAVAVTRFSPVGSTVVKEKEKLPLRLDFLVIWPRKALPSPKLDGSS
jgi:hypothetical protein